MTRQRILERAGYLVRAVDSPSEFHAAILREAVDLVFLCQTLTDEESREAVRLLSIHRPSASCITMDSDVVQDLPGDKFVIVDPGKGPSQWMQAVTHLLPLSTTSRMPTPPHV